MPSDTPEEIAADILVVGGGFGGCYALHTLRGLGYTVKLLEAGSDFGGVWYFNKYPGARVDSECPLYQLTVPRAWRGFKFLERYPGYVELQAYFAHMVEQLDLRKDAVFNIRVKEAKYDAVSKTWRLRAKCGLIASSKYVIFATGTTNKAYVPPFPGKETFRGQIIHPAAWPEKPDLKGKRVGLIGQGASGLQILQELAKEECDLTVFVRNPPTALPMGQRAISPREADEAKNTYDALFTWAKQESNTGYQWNNSATSFYEHSPAERRARYEELWSRGGYAISTIYPEVSYDKTANAELYQFWAEKVRARITDERKREIMAPLEQFQWIAAKRPNLETDYFEMIDQTNVQLVSLKHNTIDRFTETGIVTRTGGPEAKSEARGETTHELDLVIVATGYDSVTGSLFDMNIHDKHGITLQQKWKDEIHTWLGMMIPDVPNAFMLYGPQAPSGLANGPPFLEMQVDWIAAFLTKVRGLGVAESTEISAEAAKKYRAFNLGAYEHLLMRETPSWWNGSNIPGKIQEPLFWVAGLQTWRKQCEEGLEKLEQVLI